MAATNMTTFDDALKQYYTSEKVENLTYPDHPLLAMVGKNEKFKGKNMPIPLIYGNPQGRSSTFATAQTNATASKVVEFLLTRKKDYGVVTIGGEVLEASQGNEYAFLSAATTEINGILKSLGDSLSKSLYGDGGGALGRVHASGVAGENATLATNSDIVNFEVGMRIKAATTTGLSGSVRAGSGVGYAEITAINRKTAVLTFGDLSIAAIANDDYLFVEGDFGNKLTGLAGWVPSTDPLAAAFFGLDRTADTNRLGGVRYDGSSQPIDEAIIDASVTVGREGGKPDVCFISYTDFGKLVKTLGAQVQRDVAQTGRWAFAGVEMYAPSGTIKVIPDKDCPVGRAFLLQMDTWKLYSIGGAPRILKHDGMEMLRQASADGVELRAGYYAQLGCHAPGWNCNVTLPS
tara:strand:+ start:3058 stop:4272 length:1215 start_codon:yes stop_codon:yes gene_type:complete